MEFFKELFLMSEGLDLTMKVVRVGNELTISVFPDKADGITPIALTGTYEEFDKEFFNLIKAPMDKARVTVANLGSYMAQLEALEKKEKEQLETKKNSKPAATAKTAGKAKAAPAKNKKTGDDDQDDDAVEKDDAAVKSKKAKAVKKIPAKVVVKEEPKPGEQQKPLFS